MPSLHHVNGTLCTCAGPPISCCSLLKKQPTRFPNKCDCHHTLEDGAVTASVALGADVCFGALVMDPRRHKHHPTPPTSSHQTTDRRMRRTARAHMLRGQPLLGWCTCVGGTHVIAERRRQPPANHRRRFCEIGVHRQICNLIGGPRGGLQTRRGSGLG